MAGVEARVRRCPQDGPPLVIADEVVVVVRVPAAMPTTRVRQVTRAVRRELAAAARSAAAATGSDVHVEPVG